MFDALSDRLQDALGDVRSRGRLSEDDISKAMRQVRLALLEAEGQSKAIETVFDAIHRGDADPKLLAYQYLQVLPQIAQGESNKVWIIPSEVTQALGQLSAALPRARPEPSDAQSPSDGPSPS